MKFGLISFLFLLFEERKALDFKKFKSKNESKKIKKKSRNGMIFEK
jgi:hypothetical protein